MVRVAVYFSHLKQYQARFLAEVPRIGDVLLSDTAECCIVERIIFSEYTGNWAARIRLGLPISIGKLDELPGVRTTYFEVREQASTCGVLVRLRGDIEVDIELARVPEPSERIQVGGQRFEVVSRAIFAIDTPVVFVERRQILHR